MLDLGIFMGYFVLVLVLVLFVDGCVVICEVDV